MRYLKVYEEFGGSIESVCKKYGINNYTFISWPAIISRIAPPNILTIN